MEEPRLIKKNRLTIKTIDRQNKYLLLAIMCVITLFIGSSYAILTNFDKTDDTVTFKTGNLNLTVNNTLINLEDKLPESDEIGLLNATPIPLNLENTGTMFIAGYDVKLVKNSNQTSTLEDKYIKFSVSEDGNKYSNPKILTTNSNIIFTGYDLEVDVSKTIYLKVWIDNEAGNNALAKTYYGSIAVELYQHKEKEDPYNSCFETRVLANNTIEITNYYKYDEASTDSKYLNELCTNDVVIPSSINGVNVTSIGESAFEHKGLTSVSFPETLISIGDFAFAGNDFDEVTVPNSLTTLGAYVFDGDVGDATVNIGNGIQYIGDGAIADCLLFGSNVTVNIDKTCAEIEQIAISSTNTTSAYPWSTFFSFYTLNGTDGVCYFDDGGLQGGGLGGLE